MGKVKEVGIKEGLLLSQEKRRKGNKEAKEESQDRILDGEIPGDENQTSGG
jgi:hypothetical protein